MLKKILFSLMAVVILSACNKGLSEYEKVEISEICENEAKRAKWKYGKDPKKGFVKRCKKALAKELNSLPKKRTRVENEKYRSRQLWVFRNFSSYVDEE